MAATAADIAEVRALERATMAAWPALESIADRGWVARFSRGLTKRSNALTVLDPDDDVEVEARLDRLAAQYRGRDLPPIARLTPLTGPATRAALMRRGQPLFEQSLVMTAPVAALADDRAIRLDPRDPRWIGARQRLAGVSDANIATLQAMLDRLSGPAVGLVIEDADGADVAVAIVLAHGVHALVCHVVVDEAMRGLGYGTSLLYAASAWAADNGAGTMFLQVLAANAPAIALYTRLGFMTRYSYEHVVFA